MQRLFGCEAREAPVAASSKIPLAIMRARSPRRDRSKDRRRDKYERGSDTDSNAEHSNISPALLRKRRRRQLICIVVGCSAVGTVFLQLGLITGFEMKGTNVRFVCDLQFIQ